MQKLTDLSQKIQAQNGYKKPIGFGIARLIKNAQNKTLSADFSVVNWQENEKSANLFLAAAQQTSPIDFASSELIIPITQDFVSFCATYFESLFSASQDHPNVESIQVLQEMIKTGEFSNHSFSLVVIFEDAKPKSLEAVYLKLYALSLEKASLRSLNLDGAFGILPNLAWQGNKPYELDYLRKNRTKLILKGEYPSIDYIDKFPRYLMHIIPSDNTRILDTSKVRMGARLSSGTTVMPGASYINFNAGTLGASMVEGRISSSAIVGDGSDVGGGASILGVLSGTDGRPISVGKNCLLGANSVTGIPLGDGCIVDAGVAVLEGTKVSISQTEQEKLNPYNKNFFDKKTQNFKAKDLSGMNLLHFRQNSLNGQIQCYKSTREIRLNEDLH